MVKQASFNTPVNTSFAEVYWHEARNFAREKPSTKRGDLVKLLRDGWNPTLGAIPVEKIDVASQREAADYPRICTEARQAQWDALKADKSADGAIKLKAFVELFTKNGKLIAPKFLANACFQRGLTYFDSQFMALKEGGEISDMVPTVLRDYKSEGERLSEQVAENEQKTMGSEPLSDRDRLRTAKRFYDLGYKEAFLRRMYKDTTGQKLYKICFLDQQWPNLHILERLLKSPEDTDSIPYGPIPVPDLISLARRSVPTDCKPGEQPITEKELADWFNDVKGKRGNRAKIMDRESIESLSKQSPNKLVQNVAKAILENNLDLVAPLVPISKGVELILESAMLGIYPEIEAFLVKRIGEVKATKAVTEQSAATVTTGS